MEITTEYKGEYKKLSKLEKKNLVSRYKELKALELKGWNLTAKARAADVVSAIDNLIEALCLRVGIEGFFGIVRNRIKDFMEPKWYFSNPAIESYMSLITRNTPFNIRDVGIKLQSFTIASCDVMKLFKSDKERIAALRSEIVDLVKEKLDKAAGRLVSCMFYTGFAKHITWNYGMVAGNWPVPGFNNPSKAVSDIGEWALRKEKIGGKAALHDSNEERPPERTGKEGHKKANGKKKRNGKKNSPSLPTPPSTGTSGEPQLTPEVQQNWPRPKPIPKRRQRNTTEIPADQQATTDQQPTEQQMTNSQIRNNSPLPSPSASDPDTSVPSISPMAPPVPQPDPSNDPLHQPRLEDTPNGKLALFVSQEPEGSAEAGGSTTAANGSAGGNVHKAFGPGKRARKKIQRFADTEYSDTRSTKKQKR
ncbi:hypothetical protein PQX77_016289 [Marasmius sp. AFHP31]|nr:hypothetical protein PQX77_016289 [Marasmius sp. AFHP31]